MAAISVATAALAQGRPEIFDAPTPVPSLTSIRLETIRARDESLLRDLASALVTRYGDLLEGTQILFTRVESFGTVFYRMDIQNIDGEETARRICALLEMERCLVAKPGASALVTGDAFVIGADGLIDIEASSAAFGGAPSGSVEFAPLATQGALMDTVRLPVPPAEALKDRLGVLPQDRPAHVGAALPAPGGAPVMALLPGAVPDSLDIALARARATAVVDAPDLVLPAPAPVVPARPAVEPAQPPVVSVASTGPDGEIAPIAHPVHAAEDVVELIAGVEGAIAPTRPPRPSRQKNVEPTWRGEGGTVYVEAARERLFRLPFVRPAMAGAPTGLDEGNPSGSVDAPVSVADMSAVRPQMRPAGLASSQGDGVDHAQDVQVAVANAPRPKMRPAAAGMRDIVSERMDTAHQAAPVPGLRPSPRPTPVVAAAQPAPPSGVQDKASALPQPVWKAGPRKPLAAAPSHAARTIAPQEVKATPAAPGARVDVDTIARRAGATPTAPSVPDQAADPVAAEAMHASPPALAPHGAAGRSKVGTTGDRAASSLEEASVAPRQAGLRPRLRPAVPSVQRAPFRVAADMVAVMLAAQPMRGERAAVAAPVQPAQQRAVKAVVAAPGIPVPIAQVYGRADQAGDHTPAVRPMPEVVVVTRATPAPQGAASTVYATRGFAERAKGATPVRHMAAGALVWAPRGETSKRAKHVVVSPASIAMGEAAGRVEENRALAAAQDAAIPMPVEGGVHLDATPTTIAVAHAVATPVHPHPPEIRLAGQSAQDPTPASPRGARVVAVADGHAFAPAVPGDRAGIADAVLASVVPPQEAPHAASRLVPPHVVAEVGQSVAVAERAPVPSPDVALDVAPVGVPNVPGLVASPSAAGEHLLAALDAGAAPSLGRTDVAQQAPAGVRVVSADVATLPRLRLGAQDRVEGVLQAAKGTQAAARHQADMSLEKTSDRDAKILKESASDRSILAAPVTLSASGSPDPARLSQTDSETMLLETAFIAAVLPAASPADALRPVQGETASAVLATPIEVASAAPAPSRLRGGRVPATPVVAGVDGAPIPSVRMIAAEDRADAPVRDAQGAARQMREKVRADLLEPAARPIDTFLAVWDEPMPLATSELALATAEPQAWGPAQLRGDALPTPEPALFVPAQPATPFQAMGQTLDEVQTLEGYIETLTDPEAVFAPPSLPDFAQVAQARAESSAARAVLESVVVPDAGAEGGPRMALPLARPDVQGDAPVEVALATARPKPRPEGLPSTIRATVGADGIAMEADGRRVLAPRQPVPASRYAVVLNDTYAVPFDLSGTGKPALQRMPLLRPAVAVGEVPVTEPTARLISASTDMSRFFPTPDLRAPDGADAALGMLEQLRGGLAETLDVLEVAQQVAPVEAEPVPARPPLNLPPIDSTVRPIAAVPLVGTEAALPEAPAAPAAAQPPVVAPPVQMAAVAPSLPSGGPVAETAPAVPDPVPFAPSPTVVGRGSILDLDTRRVAPAMPNDSLMIRLSYAASPDEVTVRVRDLMRNFPQSMLEKGRFYGSAAPASPGLFIVGIQAHNAIDRDDLVTYMTNNGIPFVLPGQSGAPLLGADHP